MFSFWWLLLFAMVIWMTIKTARASGALAALVFLFWPSSALVMIKHWGDPSTDIRLPFAIALVAAFFVYTGSQRALDDFVIQNAPYMSEADIELIRRDNPELAAKIDAARAGYDEGYDDEDGGYRAPVAPRQPVVVQRPSSAPMPARDSAPARGEPERPALPPRELPPPSLSQVASKLSYRLGRIAIEPAGAQLALPQDFRFAGKSVLPTLARMLNSPLDEETLGWVVHRDVDLGHPDGWFVEVRYRPLATLDLAPLPYAERVGVAAYLMRAVGQHERGFGEGPYAPAWDAARTTVTASVPTPGEDETLLDAWAIRPLPQGALIFILRGSDPSRHELGLRATRLLAGRVQVEQTAPSADSPADSPLPPLLAQWLKQRPAKG
jgi:hypothetical protein